MNKRFLAFLSLVVFVLCSLLSGCNKNNANGENKLNKYSQNSFDYFDTVSVITGYAESQEEFDKVANECMTLLGEYHKLYTIYHRFENFENLCTINELVNGEHRTVKVDHRIIDLLLYSKEMYNKTNGMVNVAMGSVLSLWHDYRTIGMDNLADASLPPMDKLQEASKHTDINKMVIDEANCTVTLTDPLMKLDVGAIAKGYATEQIAKSLEEQGIEGYVLNIGGNVRSIGPKADGEAWVVGVENPDGSADYLSKVKLQGEALVTSGSYQRYYIVDGEKYHHIIDPKTLMPAKGFTSVSVICKDSGLGDAFSTALFCMSLDEGLSLVESTENVEVMWLKEDGTKTFSSGWNNYLND